MSNYDNIASNNVFSRVKKIEERNKRVELDKAWEVSWTRRIIIVILTYLVVVLFFYGVGVTRPFVNALVPEIGRAHV